MPQNNGTCGITVKCRGIQTDNLGKITVHDLTQGGEDIVSTVCGGFPYGGLRWYEWMADSSAVDMRDLEAIDD